MAKFTSTQIKEGVPEGIKRFKVGIEEDKELVSVDVSHEIKCDERSGLRIIVAKASCGESSHEFNASVSEKNVGLDKNDFAVIYACEMAAKWSAWKERERILKVR